MSPTARSREDLTAAIVESELVGGECSYWACIPSKALLRPGLALEEARNVMGAREAITGKLSAPDVFKRRDSFVSNWNDSGQAKWLEHAKVDLIRGHGRLAGERKVVVTDKEGAQTNLTARHAVVVCTGSRALVPDVPGLAEARPWTNREAVGARTVPRRLAILGGGVVACEMATLWKQLGTDEITIIQRGARLIPRYEPFASDLLRVSFEQRGITVLTETTIQLVERQHDGVVRLSLSNGKTLFADQVLAATGRLPRTQDIGLESVGLKPGIWLDVDDSMRVKEVAGGWLYAVRRCQSSSLADAYGEVSGARVRRCHCRPRQRQTGGLTPAPWTQYSATADACAVPQVIFSDPEIAAVGLTEDRGESPWDECASS